VEALDLVGLTPLKNLTAGHSDISVGLIDGPVQLDHPGLERNGIVGTHAGPTARRVGQALAHGTFVAGILKGRRESGAPAICPGCTLLVRPVFPDLPEGAPHATVGDVAAAISECVRHGARLINISLALEQPSLNEEVEIWEALDHAARSGSLVLAAAGNTATLGSSAITRHPWVIPVAGSTLSGRPMGISNLSRSAGIRGLLAPGEGVTSLTVGELKEPLRGTSVAVPIVTGAAALLWSLFPEIPAPILKSALLYGGERRRRSVVPPLLDVWSAYRLIRSSISGPRSAA
jgi:subtilisin family serine protease